MTADDLRAELTRRGVPFAEKEEPYGTRFEYKGGEIFRAYKSEKLVCQGKDTPLSREIKELHQGGAVAAVEAPATPQAKGPDIFIVYGHDTTARDQLELLLRRMGFNPIILLRAIPSLKNLIGTLRIDCNASVVLASPHGFTVPS